MIALTPILFSLFGCQSNASPESISLSSDLIGKNAAHVEKFMDFGSDGVWHRYHTGKIVSATEDQWCIDYFEVALVNPLTNSARPDRIWTPPERSVFCGSPKNFLVENEAGAWIPQSTDVEIEPPIHRE